MGFGLFEQIYSSRILGEAVIWKASYFFSHAGCMVGGNGPRVQILLSDVAGLETSGSANSRSI
jgi:hypothetical protein